MIFREKRFDEHKMSFDFLYKSFWNTSPSKKNSPSHYHKYTQIGIQSARYSVCLSVCLILVKFQYYRQNFEKYSNSKFHLKNPSSASPAVQCGGKDTKKLMVAFRDFGKSD
jgi:hypothetical protein